MPRVPASKPAGKSAPVQRKAVRRRPPAVSKKPAAPPAAGTPADLAADERARAGLAGMAQAWVDDVDSNIRGGKWRTLRADLRALLLLAEALVALEEKVGREGGAA
jgi:hypothetical protein